MSVKSQNAKKFVCYFTNYDLFYRAPLSSVRQNIIVTIIIVWYCCHHYFIMSSLTDTDVLDLLVQDEDLEELLLSLSCPFVFHSGMNCPVVSCGFSSYKTKKSWRVIPDTQRPDKNPITSSFTVLFPDASQLAGGKPICGKPPSIHPPSESNINYCCFELNNIVRYFFFYKTYIAFYNNSFFRMANKSSTL